MPRDTHLDREHTRGWMNVRSFGAKGDGVTDDSAAIREAISESLAQAQPVPVLLSGRHRIASPLIIDRLVDTAVDVAEFRIVGSGPGAGLYVDTEIKMIDSTLPLVGGLPQSEGISFENLHFEVSDATLSAWVLAPDKFLRLQFANCNFRKIRLVSSAIFAQSYHFLGGNIRRWRDAFLNCAGSFDISFIGVTAEAGDVDSTLINSVAPPGGAGTVGMRLLGNLVEGIKGAALRATGANGLSIVGNYFEAVGQGGTEPSINLNAGAMENEGVFIGGNFFGATQAFGWEIVWGPTRGGVSAGNVVAAGSLHDDNAATYRISSTNDLASGALFRSGRPAGGFDASSVRGDESVTLTVAASARVQRYTAALTANRTVTLSAVGAVNGDTFRVVRTGLGAFTLDVGGLKTIPAGTAAFVDVTFDGAAWRLTGYGLL